MKIWPFYMVCGVSLFAASIAATDTGSQWIALGLGAWFLMLECIALINGKRA